METDYLISLCKTYLVVFETAGNVEPIEAAEEPSKTVTSLYHMHPQLRHLLANKNYYTYNNFLKSYHELCSFD